MLMVLAEYERELTIDRIKAGQKRAAAEGKQIGKRGKDRGQRRKSGYWLRWSKKTTTKKINQNSEEQNINRTPPIIAGVN